MSERQSMDEWAKQFRDRRMFGGRAGSLAALSDLRDAIISFNQAPHFHLYLYGITTRDPLVIMTPLGVDEYDRICSYDKCIGKQEPADHKILILRGPLKEVDRKHYHTRIVRHVLHTACMEDLVADKRFPFPKDRKMEYPLV